MDEDGRWMMEDGRGLELKGRSRAGIILAVAVALLAGDNLGNAAIEWETMRQSVRLRQGEKEVRTTFRFVNRRTPSKITHISTSCGCTDARVEDRDLEAGEAGHLDVVFRVDSRRGVQRKYIRVETYERGGGAHELVLIVDVPEKIWLVPRFVWWESASDGSARLFHVGALSRARLKGVRATATHPGWDVEVSPDGGGYRVQVRHPADGGAGSTVVAITADVEGEGAISLPVFARVFGEGERAGGP